MFAKHRIAIFSILLASLGTRAAGYDCGYFYSHDTQSEYRFPKFENKYSVDRTKITIGNSYQFFIKSKNELIVGKVVDEESIGDQHYYYVKTSNGIKSFAAHDLTEVKSVTTTNSAFSNAIYSLTDGINQTIKAAKFVFYPFKVLSKATPDLEVLGSLRSSVEIGERLGVNLKQFDGNHKRFGFSVPRYTRVVVFDTTVVSDMFGPFNNPRQLVNIWSWKKGGAIAMTPYLLNKAVIENRSVAFHERMHSILGATFDKNSFVEQRQNVQEALCDFAAALETGDPRIARKVISEAPLRDIELREKGQFEDDVKHLNSVLDLNQANYRDNSLFISNFFWGLLQRLGAEKFSSVYLNLLEGYNAYHASYIGYLKRTKRDSVDEVVKSAQDIEFILASTLAFADSLGDPSLRQALYDVVENFTQSISFSFDAIEMVKQQIRKSDI